MLSDHKYLDARLTLFVKNNNKKNTQQRIDGIIEFNFNVEIKKKFNCNTKKMSKCDCGSEKCNV